MISVNVNNYIANSIKTYSTSTKNQVNVSLLPSVFRLVLTVISVDNLIQLLEVSAPFQRDVGVEKLITGLNIPSGIDFERVFIEESNHAGVCRSLLASVVEGSAAASHSPRLH